MNLNNEQLKTIIESFEIMGWYRLSDEELDHNLFDENGLYPDEAKVFETLNKSYVNGAN